MLLSNLKVFYCSLANRMPPNVKGGKGYRKGKHSNEGMPKMIEWDEADGQSFGRVLKKMGDRRFRIYCNDNRERICKLRGALRKSDWVEEGSIVLISKRELQTVYSDKTESKNEEIGDILAVVDPRLYSKLKKEEGVNQLLFSNIEKHDTAHVKRLAEAQENGEDIDDEMFERNPVEGGAVEEEGAESEGEGVGVFNIDDI